MVSTTPPSGFRDFVLDDARLRFALIQKISDVYQRHGFGPLETPALENLNVLLGSGGGEENEKLIFKVMKRGDKLKQALSQGEDAIADFGLRFDLTVPLSRVVAEYRGQLQFPYKVYHIGPVWRAERAQKGRFREFIQCDVDIVGSKSWAAEVEVIQAVVTAIHEIGASGFELRINDRRLLQAVGRSLGLSESEFGSFAILLDKKDKLEPNDLLSEIKEFLGSRMNPMVEKILREQMSLQDFMGLDESVTVELKKLIETIESLNLPLDRVVFDPSLVRGIGYYTGAVFELRHSSAGYSFGGGGRYDKLIGRFSKDSLPACGFSIGFERLFLLLKENHDVMKADYSTGVFFPVFSETLRGATLALATQLRKKNIPVDCYADEAPLKKQFKYASDRHFEWAVIAGDAEIKSRVFKIKNLKTNSESSISEADLLSGSWFYKK